MWGVSYTPHERYLCDRIFHREQKNRSFGFRLLISDLMLAIFTKTSSVTKRNIMDGVKKVVGMAYTPHQCSYSDRKSPYWEKSPKVSEGTSGTLITIPNTLSWWLYLYSTLCTILGPFQHRPGPQMAILAPNRPLGKGRTVLHILNSLKTCSKVVNAKN